MEEKEKIEFDMTKLVLSTYNKIAMWVNNDYDSTKQKSDALKIVSQDIIQCALEDILAGLNLKTSTEVYRGDTKVGDIQTVKESESFNKVDDKEIFNKLFINKPKS